MSDKIGGLASPWIELEKPKPPAVSDRYVYWSHEPPSRSARCAYWVRQFERGFRPNNALRSEGYDNAAGWYGVWIWEYINVLAPLEYAPVGSVQQAEEQASTEPKTVR